LAEPVEGEEAPVRAVEVLVLQVLRPLVRPQPVDEAQVAGVPVLAVSVVAVTPRLPNVAVPPFRAWT
jgi:hypothetical protein